MHEIIEFMIFALVFPNECGWLIYAEVVNFCGPVEAKDCQLYNEEVAQLRNKTLKMFLKVLCSHLLEIQII